MERTTSGWSLRSNVLEAQFRMTEQGRFEFASLILPQIDERWTAHPDTPSSPIRFSADGLEVNARTPLRLVTESVERLPKNGVRLNLDFEELESGLRVLLALETYDDRQVLRHSVRVRNLSGNTRLIEMADMLPWSLVESGDQPAIITVNQWSVLPPASNFDVKRAAMQSDTPVWIQSGAGQRDCTWLATRTSNGRGLFAGWEFDGRARAQASYNDTTHAFDMRAEVSDLHHPLQPGEEFVIPPAFLGAYRGDWDEAGFRTQRFVEDVLAAKAPDGTRFPYVVWDSWGYEQKIDEATLRRNAELAAKLGVELFIVDLGWAKQIGDWAEDPAKFPSGLLAFSDYVHSLGMKFGLHMALAEAAELSEVALQHPDWLATEPYQYFGARSLCLSHKPAQQWVIAQTIRLIDEFKVDWILQDGEHIVKRCERANHTHDPLDSNYSNSMDGLNTVLSEVQRQRPNTSWENCANGGSMMTFNMVKNYVTSITNDASGALSSRQAAYGATYPFPPRYTDRYMPERPSDAYTTRSYMFGGPWIFMNRLPELTTEQMEFARSEIATYKDIRELTRDGKVFHLSAAPAANFTDAIESYDAATDSAVAIVTRDSTASQSYMLRLNGLRPEGVYRITFQNDSRVYSMTGSQLENRGVPVTFSRERDAEIVYAQPVADFSANSRSKRILPRTRR